MDNFEEFLKNEAAGFKIQPSEKVWENVQAGISKPRRIFIWWYSAASLVILSCATLWYFTQSNNNTSDPGNNNSKDYKVENPLINSTVKENKDAGEKTIPNEETKTNVKKSPGTNETYHKLNRTNGKDKGSDQIPMVNDTKEKGNNNPEKEITNPSKNKNEVSLIVQKTPLSYI